MPMSAPQLVLLYSSRLNSHSWIDSGRLRGEQRLIRVPGGDEVGFRFIDVLQFSEAHFLLFCAGCFSREVRLNQGSIKLNKLQQCPYGDHGVSAGPVLDWFQ